MKKIIKLLEFIFGFPEYLTKEYIKYFETDEDPYLFTKLQVGTGIIGILIFFLSSMLLTRNTNISDSNNTIIAIFVAVIFYFLVGFITICFMNYKKDIDVNYSLRQKIKYSSMFVLSEVTLLAIMIIFISFFLLLHGDK